MISEASGLLELNNPVQLSVVSLLDILSIHLGRSQNCRKSMFASLCLGISAFVVFLCCAGLFKMGVISIRVRK